MATTILSKNLVTFTITDCLDWITSVSGSKSIVISVHHHKTVDHTVLTVFPISIIVSFSNAGRVMQRIKSSHSMQSLANTHQNKNGTHSKIMNQYLKLFFIL